MLTVRLYELAFRYKKTRLWMKISESKPFAVKTKKGEVLYVCVMGPVEHIAVLVFTEEEIQDYYRIHDHFLLYDRRFSDEDFERCISVSFLECRFLIDDEMPAPRLERLRTFVKKHDLRFGRFPLYPVFHKYAPYRVPCSAADRTDMEHLIAGLEASLALAELSEKDPAFLDGMYQIGNLSRRAGKIPLFAQAEDGCALAGTTALPPRRKRIYPTGSAGDDAVIRALLPRRRRGTVECGVFWLDDPKCEDPRDVPFYPAFLLAVEAPCGRVLSRVFVDDYEKDFEVLLAHFLRSLAMRKSRPSLVRAADERTYALLRNSMKKAGVRLDTDPHLPALSRALDDLYRELRGEEDAGPDPENHRETSSRNTVQLLSKILSGNSAFLKDCPEAVLPVLGSLLMTSDSASARRDRS